MIHRAPGFGEITMLEFILFVGHACITLVALIGLALRIEHRLTKIETDVSWLKARYVENNND